MENAMLVINTDNGMSENSRTSFKDACHRWSCDYIEITDRYTPYHPASLKLKAFDICPHDRILILDADTIIRIDAPSIFTEATNPEKIYGVSNHQSFYPGINTFAAIGLTQQQVESIMAKKVIHNKIDATSFSQKIMNSGVYVATRHFHEEVLTLAFYLFIGVPLQWWDQVPLNVAIFTILGGYEDLGINWNRQFPRQLEYMDAWIYHFAGNPSRYEILKTVNWQNV